MFWILAWLTAAAALAVLMGRWLRAAPFAVLDPEERSFFLAVSQRVRERTPQFEVVGLSLEGYGVQLSAGEELFELPLGRLRNAVLRASPELREREFAERSDLLLSELRALWLELRELDVAQAREQLLPQIAASAWVEESSPEFGLGQLVRQPLFEGMEILFVLDDGETRRHVTEGHRLRLELSVDEMGELAVEHLHRRAGLEDALPGAHEDERVLATGDGYDATRVLLALQAEDLDQAGDLIFALPDRDALHIGRRADDLSGLMQHVEDAHREGKHPISPQLFRVEGQQLRPVDLPGADTPALQSDTEARS
jgi:uncharacterized protein YtpQ (UPF0354 family)